MLAGFHAGMNLAQPIPAGPIMACAIFSGYKKQAIPLRLRERARMSPFQALKCEVLLLLRIWGFEIWCIFLFTGAGGHSLHD